MFQTCLKQSKTFLVRIGGALNSTSVQFKSWSWFMMRWTEMVMVMVMSVKRMLVIGFLVWTSSSGQYGKRFKHRVL